MLCWKQSCVGDSKWLHHFNAWLVPYCLSHARAKRTLQASSSKKGEDTVFENHKKVSFNIASEASYAYNWVDKIWLKMPKTVNLATFWKPKSFSLTVLPDKPFSIGQKLIENAKMVLCFCFLVDHLV